MAAAADFEIFKRHLNWAAGGIDQSARNRANFVIEAEHKWQHTVSSEDRKLFVQLIDICNEAREYLWDSWDVFERLELNGGWREKWSQLVVLPLEKLSDEEINELQAYLRVSETYLICTEAYGQALANLSTGYIKYELHYIFQRVAKDFASCKSECDKLQPIISYLLTYCNNPDFIQRAATARRVKTKAVSIDAGGDKVWTQAMNLAKEKEDKLWLWIAIDGRGKVVDRYVLKRETLTPERWNDGRVWKHRGGSTIEPMEAYLQNKCWQADRDNFVGIRSFTFSGHTIEYRINYCPFGDLVALLRQYERQVIPEPILWYIFESLAAQCITMRSGTHDPHWQEIVHLDIKPENIFLDVPTRTRFPAYPTAKMADFGFAFETSSTDKRNPASRQHMGTPPFMAPEQVHHISGRDECGRPAVEKILSHTNVWAIGMVMLELVNDGELGDQKTYTNGRPDYHEINRWARHHYSPALLSLIGKCIQYWPSWRIRAGYLHRRILAERETISGGVGAYCRAAANGQQAVGGVNEWRTAREKYKLMMTR